MAYKTNHDGQQRIMNHLADSVFELSDQEILDEVRKTGADPQEEADRHELCAATGGGHMAVRERTIVKPWPHDQSE